MSSVEASEQQLAALDVYIEQRIGTKTTRHASENNFNCPPITEAALAVRAMRQTIHDTFDGRYTPGFGVDGSLKDLATTKTDYWRDAQYADESHGAYPGYTLDNYFHASPTLSYGAVRASIEERYPPESLTAHMFGALDMYQQELGVSAPFAARAFTHLLHISLPAVRYAATKYESMGESPPDAGQKALSDFIGGSVSQNIRFLNDLLSQGVAINAHIAQKTQQPEEVDQSSKPLRLYRSDIEGLVRVRQVQIHPYTDQELALADTVMGTPNMQHAILIFHQRMIKRAESYFGAHAERLAHNLEPFTEIFITRPDTTGAASLVPNPKLVPVIGNNIIPAVARLLLGRGEQNPSNIKSSDIAHGIELAKNLGVFQTEVGQFTNYDSETDSAELTTLFARTCPAMQMFSQALREDLPILYDICRKAPPV